MLSDIYGKGVCYKVKNIFYFPLEGLLISAFAQVFLAIRTKIIQVFFKYIYVAYSGWWVSIL